MATQPTCGKIIKVTVHLRDKSTKIINENVCGKSGDCSEMMSLLDSTRSMQEKLNQFLSNLVENERRNGANESHDVNNVLVEEGMLGVISKIAVTEDFYKCFLVLPCG